MIKVMSLLSKESLEKIMLYAVLSQSLWGLCQTALIDVFNINENIANQYRVLLVAITMGYAIIWGIRKKPVLFISTYSVVCLLLAFTTIIFPQNTEYLLTESAKLTLPLVIPSCLCVACIDDYNKLEDIFYKLSWVSVFVAIIYAYTIITGSFIFSNYSMSFSFSLLLPTLILYSRHKKFSFLASVFLLIEIIALGSRSAAIVIVFYILIEAFTYRKKMILPLLVVCVFLLSILNALGGYLEDYGITSRTLAIFESDEGLLGHMSHRDEIYDLVISKIEENEFFGLGLFGDRLFLNGSTCHNFILEILLNFGVVIGGGILIFLFLFIVRVFLNLSKYEKIQYLLYFSAVMIPLMVSGSYLKDFNFGLMLGIILLFRKQYMYRTVSVMVE